MLPLECVLSGQPSRVPSQPWPPGMAHVKVPGAAATPGGSRAASLCPRGCTEGLGRPDSPPALPRAVTCPRPRRALRGLVPCVTAVMPVASVSVGRWMGRKGPVLSECGSWGSVEPGSVFSVFQWNLNIFQSHLLSPTHSRPRASCFYLDRLSPRWAGHAGAWVQAAPSPRLLQGSSPGAGLCGASMHTPASYLVPAL